jgi:hypothetical protein
MKEAFEIYHLIKRKSKYYYCLNDINEYLTSLSFNNDSNDTNDSNDSNDSNSIYKIILKLDNNTNDMNYLKQDIIQVVSETYELYHPNKYVYNNHKQCYTCCQNRRYLSSGCSLKKKNSFILQKSTITIIVIVFMLILLT